MYKKIYNLARKILELHKFLTAVIVIMQRKGAQLSTALAKVLLNTC